MWTETFCAYALSLFLQAQACWAQLHTGDPGPDGLLAGSVDRRRRELVFGPLAGTRVASTNALRWDEVQGVPGFPQQISWLTLWSGEQGGVCWARYPIAPIRVPHLATLTIPPGLVLDLTALQAA